jgi:hypothetical protein
MRRLYLLVLFLFTFTAALALTACASLAVVLTKTYVSVEKSLATVDDGEYDLCFGTHDPAVITQMTAAQLVHCSSPVAGPAGLTDARHLQLTRQLKDAFDAQVRLGPILKTWTAGPIPKDLATALSDAAQVNSLAQALDPKAPNVQPFLDDITLWIKDLASIQATITGG